MTTKSGKFIEWEPYRGAVTRQSREVSLPVEDKGERQKQAELQRLNFLSARKVAYKVDPMISRTSTVKPDDLNVTSSDPPSNRSDDPCNIFPPLSASSSLPSSTLETVPADPFASTLPSSLSGLLDSNPLTARTLADDVKSSLSSRQQPTACKAENTDKLYVDLKEKYHLLMEDHQHALVAKEAALDQLEVQSKVNAELKRLLVATMGDDLQLKLECLSHDKVRLGQDIIHYTRKLSEDHENIERLAIQCDVWRSKFLASSVMIDELNSWRYFIAKQFENAQHVVSLLVGEIEQKPATTPAFSLSAPTLAAATKVLKVDASSFYGANLCDDFGWLRGRACNLCYRENCPGVHGPDFLTNKNLTLACCSRCRGNEIKLV